MEKTITLTDSEDREVEAEILFTFEHEKENYVLLTIEEKETDFTSVEDDYPVLAYKYEELEGGKIGNLIEIADGSSDWDIVEEMFNTFNNGDFENE